MTVPSFKVLGGVANHYQGLQSHWKEDVTYFTIGRRKHVPAVLTIIPDFVRLFFLLLFHRYDAVLLNTSFKTIPLHRDAVNLFIARLFTKHVSIFIHGWDEQVAQQIAKRPKRFSSIYNRTTFIYVLFSGFREQLLSMGISVPVLLTSTKVSDSLVEGFDISTRDSGNVDALLFMARADKAKGLNLTLKTYERLKQRHTHLKLYVCGDGDALPEAKEYVAKNNIRDVEFSGFVKGDDRIPYFEKSQIYMLPTTHGEGMATSVLEAMAMGMVVISRPVGGVIDFFKDDEMGYLIESIDVDDYVNHIEALINNPEKVRHICRVNNQYAREHFMASSVAASIENDLRRFCTT